MKINGSSSKISLFFSLFLVFSASVLRGQVKPKPYEIVISEIMTKPLAKKDLPNLEYIELYNKLNDTIDITGFKVVNGNKSKTIHGKKMKPKSYLIIYKKTKDAEFWKFGDTLAIDSLFTLGNSTDDFFLKNKTGEIIDAVAYDRLDYKSSAKSQGGYSLERVNINNPCNFDDWRGSDDSKGGTPGQKNSVSSSYKDSKPNIDYYYLKDKTVEIQFDRAINRNINSSMFYFKNDAIAFESFEFDTTLHLYNRLKITFVKKLSELIKYQFIVKSDLKNCDSTLSLAQNDTLVLQNASTTIDNKDTILINEVLVNPQTGGSRYLEIYNKSKKVIDVKDFSISSDPALKKMTESEGYLLFPNSYLILADNPLDVQTRYNVSKLRRSFLKYKLPSWNQNEGIVLLKYDEKIRDSLFYTKNFFNPLLPNSYDGVALERINPNKPNDKSNWQSAAATVGYGTPGYRNSQYLEDTPSVLTASEEVFTIPKPTFSPDDDGFEDYLLLHYKSDKAGAFAKVFVFDVKGHLVKKWVDNEPLATEGDLKWDGETYENIKAPIGIYIIYIELITLTGEVQVFKKTISLTTRL